MTLGAFALLFGDTHTTKQLSIFEPRAYVRKNFRTIPQIERAAALRNDGLSWPTVAYIMREYHDVDASAEAWRHSCTRNDRMRQRVYRRRNGHMRRNRALIVQGPS